MSEDTAVGDVVVEVRGVVTRFGTKVVHDGIDLEIRAGEILAIVGGSGTGKSVLLREMVMLQRPSAGSIRVFGHEVTRISESQARPLRRRIGVLFQHGALFGDLTAAENLAVPLKEHTPLSRRLIDEIACLKIGLTGLQPDAATLYPSQLSGGMLKRASLARAIALDPELLFLDEPTSGLDPISADALDDLILELKHTLGLTVVLVTHDIHSLWRVTDRVVLLGNGRVLGTGTVHDLAHSDDPAVRRYFEGPRGKAAAQPQPWNKE